MIPAIDPGIGLKEDLPVPASASPAGKQNGNQKFAKALKRANGGPGTPPTGPRDRQRPEGTPHQRSRFMSERGKEAAASPADAPEEENLAAQEAAGEGEQTLEEAARRTINPHTEFSENPLGDGEDGEESPSLALNFTEEGESAVSIDEQTPINALIGTAAWRLGRHGNSEAKFATEAGVLLPGSQEAELAQAANLTQAKTALFNESQPVEDTTEVLTRNEQAEAVLKFGDEAKGKGTKQVGLTESEQIKLETAHSRNQLMSQLAAGSEEGAIGDLDSETAQNFLRERLRINGLINRSAQGIVKRTGETEAAAPLESMVPKSAGMSPAHLFETPNDPAVQQRVVEQVASEARWMINNNKNQVTLRLHPDHLGDLKLKVMEKNGVLRIDMTVDNLSAKQLLETHLNDLRARLEGDNLADEFQFNIDLRKDHQHSELQARVPNEAAPLGNRLESLEMAAEAAPARRILNHGGLSIYA